MYIYIRTATFQSHLQHVVAHWVPKVSCPNLGHKVPPIEWSSCEAQTSNLQHETAYTRDSVPLQFELIELRVPMYIQTCPHIHSKRYCTNTVHTLALL